VACANRHGLDHDRAGEVVWARLDVTAGFVVVAEFEKEKNDEHPNAQHRLNTDIDEYIIEVYSRLHEIR